MYFANRYGHSEFSYSKNNKYKIVDLHFFEKEHVEKYQLIDLLKFEPKKAKKPGDEFKVYYDNGPCDISIKKNCCIYTKEKSLKMKYIYTDYVNWPI